MPRGVPGVVGWLCPACGRGNAPTLMTCPCADQRVRTADYLGLPAPTLTFTACDGSADHGNCKHKAVGETPK